MAIFYIILSLFLIITPSLYFLYIFKNMKKTWRYSLLTCTCLSVLTILIKVLIKPTALIWQYWFPIVSFYIITCLIIFIMIAIYRLFCHVFHKKDSSHIIMIIGILALIISSFGTFEHFHKQKTNYEVSINKDTSLSSLKIAFISDIHLGNGTYPSHIDQLVSTLNQGHYDLICLGGDLFDETTPESDIHQSFDALSHIKSTYGIFAVSGNHERYTSFSNKELYQKYHITYLNNDFVCIDYLFNIIGREDVSSPHQTSLSQICQGMDLSLPTIILDHNPARYQENQEFADLQLSGHTHAGQIFPGNIITNMIYHHDYGLFQQNHFSLIVSSGYGSWGFPFRIMTQCEYLEIHVLF